MSDPIKRLQKLPPAKMAVIGGFFIVAIITVLYFGGLLSTVPPTTELETSQYETGNIRYNHPEERILRYRVSSNTDWTISIYAEGQEYPLKDGDSWDVYLSNYDIVGRTFYVYYAVNLENAKEEFGKLPPTQEHWMYSGTGFDENENFEIFPLLSTQILWEDFAPVMIGVVSVEQQAEILTITRTSNAYTQELEPLGERISVIDMEKGRVESDEFTVDTNYIKIELVSDLPSGRAATTASFSPLPIVIIGVIAIVVLKRKRR